MALEIKFIKRTLSGVNLIKSFSLGVPSGCVTIMFTIGTNFRGERKREREKREKGRKRGEKGEEERNQRGHER